MKLRYITSHYPREMLAFVPPIFNDSYDSLHHWQPPGKKTSPGFPNKLAGRIGSLSHSRVGLHHSVFS